MTDVIKVADLGKTYPGGTEALRGVSFAVERGEVFCLLGRNGAGKTTLLRILATQLHPTVGHASVFGHDVVREPEAIRNRISVLPQEGRPMMMLSAYDHIRLMCQIRGMAKGEAIRRTEELMREFDLWEHRKKLSADLSGGLRQRVLLCMALTSKPELLFLDEPTIGLDPLGRRQVWALVRRLTREGVTVLLTTHYLEEAEHLADRLVIIDKGRPIFLGTVGEAKGLAGGETRVLVDDLAVNGNGPQILRPQSDREVLEIVERSLRNGWRVSFQPPSLEDAFIRLVGGTIDAEQTT